MAFVASRLWLGARISVERRRHVLEIVRGIRWTHVAAVPPVLTAVVASAVVLTSVPGLDWGWWTALGGTGNPAVGVSDTTAGSPFEWLVPVAFLLLLLPGLPLFAEAEERWFRLGAEHRSFGARRWKDLQFGMVHALIGIPIGVAVALSIGGAAFTWWYRRGWRRRGWPGDGLRESTCAHTAYNGVIVVVVLAGLVAEIVA